MGNQARIESLLYALTDRPDKQGEGLLGLTVTSITFTGDLRKSIPHRHAPYCNIVRERLLISQ